MMKRFVRPGSMILLLMVGLGSCNENLIDYNTSDSESVKSESSADSQMEDAADMAAVVVTADAGTLNGGRTDGMSGVARSIKEFITDDRLSCARDITLTFADDNVPASIGVLANPHGYITIDFGNGCTSANGRVRKGQIVIEFKGRRFFPSSFISISFIDFYIDGVKVEGTRTETNVSTNLAEAIKFNTLEDNITVTWPDGTFATRYVNRVREWDRIQNPTGGVWKVYNGSTSLPAAAGVNRGGKSYVMNITKPLIFKRSCAALSKSLVPIEGIKELVANSKKVIMDFGSGACDNVVTVTINGKSKDITIEGD